MLRSRGLLALSLVLVGACSGDDSLGPGGGDASGDATVDAASGDSAVGATIPHGPVEASTDTASPLEAAVDSTVAEAAADGTGGSDSAVDAPPDSANTDDANRGSDSAADAPLDSANAEDANDAEVDAATREGGKETAVPCGSGSCADAGDPPNGDFCCVQSGVAPTCAPSLGMCETGDPFYCTSQSDCNPGSYCCESSVRALYSCQAPSACTNGLQLCRNSSECLNGEPCLMTVCNGESIRTCGPLDGGGTRLRCN